MRWLYKGFLQVDRFVRPQVSLLGRVRVHPLFVVLVLLAVGFGMFQEIVVLFLLIILHEIGHAAVANHLGYEVEEVSFLPFGGVAKLSYNNIGFQPKHEAAIAIAGPLVNLILAMFAYLLYAVGVWSEVFFHTVVQLNLWIAVFNLLPALPLDGGRVLRAARSRSVGYETATREAFRMAIGIAFLLLVLGGCALWAGYPHVGIIILGVFLLASAWTGRRSQSMETIRFLDSKRKVTNRSPELVRALAAPMSSTVRDVVQQFAPDRYHMIYVLDQHGAVQTVLEEDELLDAVFQGKWLDRIEMWIHRN